MFEDKLQDFYLDSVVDSESEFTLSPAKQEERLRNFQFENPRVFILLFLALASQCGATTFSLDIKRRRLLISFNAALDKDADSFLGDLPYRVVPRNFRDTYLTDAVVAAIQDHGFKTISITSQLRSKQSEFCFSRSSSQTKVSTTDLKTDFAEVASTRVVISYSLLSGAGGNEVCRLLEQWGCLARLSISINSREMPKSLSRPVRAITDHWRRAAPFPLHLNNREHSARILEFSIPGCKDSLLHISDSSYGREVNIVVDGVLYGFGRTLTEETSHLEQFVEKFSFLSQFPGFKLLIYAEGIPTDISRTSLRESSSLFSVMEKVEKALVDGLCSRVLTDSDYDAKRYLLKLTTLDRYWSEPKYDGWAKKMTEAMLPFTGWPGGLIGLEKEVWIRYWFQYLKPDLDGQNDAEVLARLEGWGFFHYYDGDDKPSKFLKFDKSPLLELAPFLPRLLKKHFAEKLGEI